MKTKLLLFVLSALMIRPSSFAASKVKLHGDVTATRPGALLILDDVFDTTKARFGTECSGPELPLGMLIEAEGNWNGKHRFMAKKVTCDVEATSKEIKESTFLEYDPLDASASGKTFRADGERLRAPDTLISKWFQPKAAASATPPDPCRPATGVCRHSPFPP